MMRPDPVLQVGQAVFLKVETPTTDDDGFDLTLAAGAAGQVVGVRECESWPRTPRPGEVAYDQGAWLYDVEFFPGGPSAPVCWLIYDAGDVHNLTTTPPRKEA